MQRIVIIGNGITGSTAARHLRKRGDDDIVVISAETDHFYSRPALMYIYMGHMTYRDTKPYEDWFWEKNRIRLVRDYVEGIDTEAKVVTLASGNTERYDKLLIACGSASNKFGWPGQDLDGVSGLYGIQDLSVMDATTRDIDRAVVVGGGLIGIEMVEMLMSRGVQVTYLVRESHFWEIVLPREEATLVDRHIREHHVDLRLEAELEEILGDERGRVRAVKTKDGEEIPCGFVGLAIGVHPNIGWMEGSGIETQKGVMIDRTFQTSAPDVYAAGDCAQFREPFPDRRPIEQVWYTGKMQGEHLAAILSGEARPYNPGIWFNSAKFMDIEYQTYGLVPSTLPEGLDSLYWEDDSGTRCFRVVYEANSRAVTAFNLLGIRGRHAVCEEWIANRTPVEEVLRDLGALNFDPEFFRRFEPAVLAAARQKPGMGDVTLRTRRGLFSPFLRGRWVQRAEGASV